MYLLSRDISLLSTKVIPAEHAYNTSQHTLVLLALMLDIRTSEHTKLIYSQFHSLIFIFIFN